MRKTLQLLTRTNKQVIFVVSTPILDFSPATCVDSRPFRLTQKSLKSPCGISRSNFDRNNQDYRDLVFRVLNDFPNVKVFDTSTQLCDSEYCWAMKDGKILYRDDVHLSVQGSEYLARELVKILPN